MQHSSSLAHALACGKLDPPRAHPWQIERQVLLERIIAAPEAAVVLLRAPAGFGKTTLLAQCMAHFRARGQAVAWLNVDRSDNDLSRFLDVLAAALAPLGMTMPTDRTMDLPTTRGTMTDDALALQLLAALAAHPTGFVLVLDEMELVTDPAVLKLLDRIAAGLTPASRLLIGARHVPGLSWHRLRLSARLLELDATAMSFSVEETTRFFQRDGVPVLSSGDLRTLHSKTEGWVAALWLASLSLSGHAHASSFVAQFSGDDRAVAECLSHDVFDQQPADVQRFLLFTSIARRLDADLCQVLLPDLPCAAIIERLVGADIILRPSAGVSQTFRYHSMFATYLRARLRATYPQALTQLHCVAARWFEACDRPVPAIDHAMDGGDFEHAARLLDQHGQGLLEQGRMRLLASWLAQLPQPVLDAAPLLRAMEVWAICFTRGPAEAMVALDALSAAAPQARQGSARGVDLVAAHVAALRPMLLSMMDRHEEAYDIGLAALGALREEGGAHQSFMATSLANAMANVSGVLGRYHEAQGLLDQARAGQQYRCSTFNTMYSEAVEGIIDLQAGRFRQAGARFRLAVGATRSGAYGQANGNAWAGVLHAAAVYESGDLVLAANLLDVYVPLGRDVGLPDHLILGYVMQARIAVRQGTAEQAFVLLGELEYLGHHRRLPRIAASARLERARILLLQGHAQAAFDELRRAENTDLWERMGRLRLPANDLLYPELARLRWQAYEGDPVSASHALAKACGEARDDGRVRRALKLRTFHSIALARAGDTEQADRVLVDVLDLGRSESLYGVIVDEAGPMAMRVEGFLHSDTGQRWVNSSSQATLAMQGWQAGLAANRDAYGGDTALVRRTGREPVDRAAAASACSVGVTPKEIGVLVLVAQGMSNGDIARRLFVSESTVRTHLRSLSAKLSASSRTHAVAIARRGGLIA